MTKSKLRQELHVATSDDPTFLSKTELRGFAECSFDREDCTAILKHVYARLQLPASKWRKVLKSLNIIEVLMEYGSRPCVKDIKEKIYLIQKLTDFQAIRGNIDVGAQSDLISPRPIRPTNRYHCSC